MSCINIVDFHNSGLLLFCAARLRLHTILEFQLCKALWVLASFILGNLKTVRGKTLAAFRDTTT